MIPRTVAIKAPSTTVQNIPIHEEAVMLTVNNMDSITDLYVSFEGENTAIWQRIPANALAEFFGDFDRVWYKLATGAVWGATDTAHVILEKLGGEHGDVNG